MVQKCGAIENTLRELVQPSHWLHANSILKIGCHNFGFELLPLPKEGGYLFMHFLRF